MKATSHALTALILLLACAIPSLAQERRSDIERAPLPRPVIEAKVIFIVNAGGSDLAYDAFYSAMNKWGRYRIADSPDSADLVFRIGYGDDGSGPHVYTNPANKMTYSYTVKEIGLTILDPKTDTALWVKTAKVEGARREKNREKNLIEAVRVIAEDLRERVEPK